MTADRDLALLLGLWRASLLSTERLRRIERNRMAYDIGEAMRRLGYDDVNEGKIRP